MILYDSFSWDEYTSGFSLCFKYQSCYLHLSSCSEPTTTSGWRADCPGGSWIIFWWGCAARGLKLLPISKYFPPSKNSWYDFFFKIFANQDSFLRVFYFKNGRFYHFFCNFCEIGPSSKDLFWSKWDPCLRIFGEKVTHLGSTSQSPYVLTCEYPPADWACSIYISKIMIVKLNLKVQYPPYF